MGPNVHVQMHRIDGSVDGDLSSADIDVKADPELEEDAGSKIGGIGEVGGFKENGPHYHERIGKSGSLEFVGDVPEVIVHAHVFSSAYPASAFIDLPSISLPSAWIMLTLPVGKTSITVLILPFMPAYVHRLLSFLNFHPLFPQLYWLSLSQLKLKKGFTS
ncbi:unnamed protein product [Dibothriocephalus latus]|uniref:Uncharacterized protein n=1 Tax=Dibothriocephalus latus TaxID=60516 RepID=A0A3P7LSW4_DIBLA|nr:unnamed protein product [Dibothriocephalus latus]